MPDPVPFATDADSYLSRIRAKYDTFTASQKKIAAYLSEHPEAILAHSITALSKKIGTTPPSLTRFCQLIHYKGFSDLKFCMEKRLSSPFGEELEIKLGDPVRIIKKKLLAMDVQAITDTLLLVEEATIEQAAQAVCAARSVLIYADGNNSASATYAYHALLQLGIRCGFFSDFCLGRMEAVKLQPGDVLLALTFSGNSSTVLDVVRDAAGQGATIIGITASANSALARAASILLCYSPHIGDDLRYLHIARMCEICLIGLVQSALINIAPHTLRENIERSKKAISSFRSR